MTLDELVTIHLDRARAYFGEHPGTTVYLSAGAAHRVRVVREGQEMSVCLTNADASDYADPLVQRRVQL